jgi:hypothetical protein
MGDHAGHGQIRSRDLKAAILALLLVGCSAQQTSSTPLPVAPTPTPGAPSIQFTFDGEEPSVTRELTGIDEAFINPGAVIADPDRTLHMFANVFTAWPGPVSVPHLTSTDGVSWAPAQPEPILTADDVPLADPGFDVSTGFIADDGTWVLIYQTVSTDPWRLGRITAPGPDGPWMVDGEPMLEPGPEGSIDAGGLTWPSIVRTDAGYLLYYTARERNPRRLRMVRSRWQPRPTAWSGSDGPTRCWSPTRIGRSARSTDRAPRRPMTAS